MFQCGVKQQRASHNFFELFEGCGPIELTSGVVKLSHSIVWPWKNSLKWTTTLHYDYDVLLSLF